MENHRPGLEKSQQAASPKNGKQAKQSEGKSATLNWEGYQR